MITAHPLTLTTGPPWRCIWIRGHYLVPGLVVVFRLSVMLNSCSPMDCSPPGSSLRGISQAGILEWVAIPFFRGSSWTRDWIQILCIADRFFTSEPQGKPWYLVPDPELSVWRENTLVSAVALLGPCRERSRNPSCVALQVPRGWWLVVFQKPTSFWPWPFGGCGLSACRMASWAEESQAVL